MAEILRTSDDALETLLEEASELRRTALVSVEHAGPERRLVFRGDAHPAVRRWIAAEQALAGALRVDAFRAASGQFCVSVAPAIAGRTSAELLAELSGE